MRPSNADLRHACENRVVNAQAGGLKNRGPWTEPLIRRQFKIAFAL
jgi:hypothetical protein